MALFLPLSPAAVMTGNHGALPAGEANDAPHIAELGIRLEMARLFRLIRQIKATLNKVFYVH